jgi:hypothetical protein
MLATDVIKGTTRLLESSKVLTRPNAERVARVFYDAIKIVYERQKRLDKKQLKMKEVSSALILAETLHSKLLHFEASGALAALFGDCDEDKAYAYFETNVAGRVTDKLGRTVTIDEDGLRSVYKDSETGKHICTGENYESYRGKRLPWIRHVLANCDAVYVKDEKVNGKLRRSFAYPATVSVPLKDGAATEYYVLILRQRKNNNELKMVTAYSVFKRNRFLKLIEPFALVDENN